MFIETTHSHLVQAPLGAKCRGVDVALLKERGGFHYTGSINITLPTERPIDSGTRESGPVLFHP
jgi:hypothetical protein